jgi:hypothetical protein
MQIPGVTGKLMPFNTTSIHNTLTGALLSQCRQYNIRLMRGAAQCEKKTAFELL